MPNDFPDPELNNQSVRAQIRDAVKRKMRLAWGDRADRLGMVLIIFDPKTGEIITNTVGEPNDVLYAIEAIKTKARSGEIIQVKAAG